ncbi:MAG: penicillin-binding protein 2 [Planctomycetes bacterium]|nr:penicillin-binding protein 2 [Planctomycetota bacterium]
MKQKVVIIVIFILLAGVFCLLSMRLASLQLNPDNSPANPKQQYAVVKQHPQRGIIVDSQSRILAASNRLDTVYAEPRAIKDIKLAASSLQEILDFPGHEICRIVDESKNPGYVKIFEGITAAQRQAIRSAKLRGIGIQTDWHRYYPMGNITSHLVGFIGTDQKPLAGLELKYDSQLKGTEGYNVLFVNAMRQPIGFKGQATIVRDGFGLILTVDTSIQQFVREALVKQYKAYKAESAIAVVMEPKSGAILSLVSLPDFEPVNIGTESADNLKNRVLTDPYEPGSIFKPIVAAIALDAGVVNINEKIFCEYGNYRGKGFGRIGEYGTHEFGDLTVKEILVHSSNIGMAKIGQRMERKRFYDGLKLFGFGSKSGIDLPGEESGTVHQIDKWTGYSETRIPFGHEVTVTAIQIARAYATLANHGRVVQPHILKAIVDNNGKVTMLKRSDPSAGYIIDPKVADWIVTEALVSVVKEGTGKPAALKEYQVFGKTGTANIAGSTIKGYDEKNYIASFAGGAPAENPKLVVLVSIRKPDRSLGKGYTGGKVAAPVVKEILDKSLTYLTNR